MKTAIYVRVSTNRQTQAQTIEQHLERLQRHLELQGEPLLAENIFRDDGYSGANLNHPGLDRLRDRVKGGILDRVLLTSPDRLARNYVHQMVLVEEWERSGCKVEFLDHPMSQNAHQNCTRARARKGKVTWLGQGRFGSQAHFITELFRHRCISREPTLGPLIRPRIAVKLRNRTLSPSR